MSPSPKPDGSFRGFTPFAETGRFRLVTPREAIVMNKTILAAGAALISVSGAALAAQPGNGPGSSRGDWNADMTMADAKARSDSMFARMDANGDGRIDSADREARQQARFDRLDTNRDGALSPEEFAARGDRMGRGDGERGHRGHHGMGGMRGGMMKMADSNGDGAIDKAEFDAMHTQHFTMMDVNNDGTVTAEERKAARQKMRGMMRDADGAR